MTVQIQAQVNVLPYPLPLDIQGELLHASTVSLEQSIATISEVHQTMVRRYACRITANTAWDGQGQLLRVLGLPELVEALNVGLGPDQDNHPTVVALHDILRRGRAVGIFVLLSHTTGPELRGMSLSTGGPVGKETT